MTAPGHCRRNSTTCQGCQTGESLTASARHERGLYSGHLAGSRPSIPPPPAPSLHRTGIMGCDEYRKFPPLSRDRYASPGHAMPDLSPHRRVPARQSERGPNRALPAGPPQGTRTAFPVGKPASGSPVSGGSRPSAAAAARATPPCLALGPISANQLSRFSLRQPPARLLAMICLNMAERAGALMVSPWRMATVRAVLLSWPPVMIPSGSGTMPPS